MTTALLGIGMTAAAATPADSRLRFDRIKLSDDAYEAASAADLNRDGKLDIICGAYWYPGPNFRKPHKMCDVLRQSEYYDDFSDFPMDVNGDGYDDVITGGWFGRTLAWRENPKGGTGEWKVHEIDRPGNIETIRYWDVDGDGRVEIIPNAADNVVVYRLVRAAGGEGTGKFEKTELRQGGIGHGLGFGDINGDGRGDFVGVSGWLEAPKEGLEGRWTWHPEFSFKQTSVPILVHDVDEDGLADLILGAGHGYGLWWYRQTRNPDGRRTWTKNVIDEDRSQYHDMMLVDIDNDKQPELVTGKRYRAHNGHDPGSNDPIGVYYFEINKGRFERVTLDYGPPDETAGVGLFFWVTDLDGNGWRDIIAPGKSGLYLFRNLGTGK